MIEKLWSIPVTWTWTEIRELGEVVSGGTPSTKEMSYWGSDVNWISPSDLTGYNHKTIAKGAKNLTIQGLKNSSAKVMPTGSIHFSSRAPIGYVVIGSEPMSTNQGFKSLVPAEGIFNEYIYYYLKSAKQLAEQRATGTTFKEISGTAFGKLPFPLPPTNEQKRIVAKIEELFSELDKGIENLKTAREQLKVYRQAVLKHAFEGKLTACWRENNPDTITLKNFISGNEVKDFPELPKGWLYTQLGEVIEEPKYGTSKKCDYDINGIGVLRIPNIVSGVVDSTDLKFANFDVNEISTYSLHQGDILTIRSNGSVSIVGKCALVREQDEKFLYAGYLIRLRPNKEYISPEFLNYVLSSHLLRTQIEHKAKSTSGVNNINAGELQSLIIPICGTEEQEEVVKILKEKLSIIERFEETIEEELQRSEALRQSILKKAFSGKLVAQDQDDEPASVLLEHIRAEKDAQQTESKKPKAKRNAA